MGKFVIITHRHYVWGNERKVQNSHYWCPTQPELCIYPINRTWRTFTHYTDARTNCCESPTHAYKKVCARVLSYREIMAEQVPRGSRSPYQGFCLISDKVSFRNINCICCLSGRCRPVRIQWPLDSCSNIDLFFLTHNISCCFIIY